MEATLYQDNTKTKRYYSASARTAGDVVWHDGEAGVCIADIAAGGTGDVYTDGQFDVEFVAFGASAGAVVGFDNDGTPYGGSTTGAGTTKLAAADFIMGTAITDATATSATIRVDLNKIPADLVAILAGRTVEAVSGNKTLDIQDSGKIMLVDTDAKAITLPAVATGFEFVIMMGAADGVSIITVSPNANDKIMGADLAGVDDKDRVLTKATAKANDFIHLVYGTADGWIVTQERGTWAAEA